MTHICISKLTITGSDNAWSVPSHHLNQCLNIVDGPSETIFSEILIEIHTYSFNKMGLKTSAKCLGLNQLDTICILHRTLFLAVVMPDDYCCQTAGDRVVVAANKGLISSYVTESSGCGGTNCPWFLEAPPGKTLNISLFDFHTFKLVSVSLQKPLLVIKILIQDTLPDNVIHSLWISMIIYQMLLLPRHVRLNAACKNCRHLMHARK